MYCKLNINNTTSRPFSVATIWDTTNKNEKVGKAIWELSRLKHGRKKEFVEEEIETRIGIDLSAPPVDVSKMPTQPNLSAPPEGNAMAQMLGAAVPASPQTPPEPTPPEPTQPTPPAA
jgi:hypothetical protein